jgi:large subunit ribosomal protein L21
MYALVEIQGKQYKAEQGKTLKVDRVGQDAGEVVVFDSVLMLRDDDKTNVGTPFVKGAQVKTVVQEHVRDPKVVVYKYKKRKGYARKRGHKQQYSVLRVEEIATGS